jgi:NAD(P)-dependent dehydrogenase (short-subunit alcohol dehydrogenase family)
MHQGGNFRRASVADEAFLDSASEQFRVNVEGSLNMAHALLPQLRETRGCIVNVASMAAFIAYRRNVVGYAASKGAVVQMTKGLAADLAQEGIRVNAITPGLVATLMTVPSRSNSAVMEELCQHALVKRFAEPEELVGAALFLSFPLSSFVTGMTLPVDGGFLAI